MAHRFEYKFLVPVGMLANMRGRLLPFVTPDPYASRRETGEYTVRSVYLDTPDLQEYHEKIAGLPIRKKLRIRVYNEEREDSVAFLEIKRKNQSSVSKDRAPILYRALSEFFGDGDVERHIIPKNGSADAVDGARKFLFHVRRDLLRPLLLVTYEREAYMGKFDQEFRCTIDKQLRFICQQNVRDMFRDTDLRPGLKGFCILEVKFERVVPVWLASIISDLGLKRGAYSKYCIGIDTVRDTNGFPVHFTDPRRLRIDMMPEV